jgi:hypothetical protein
MQAADIVEMFVEEGLTDHVGLWQVVGAVRDDLGVNGPDAVRESALGLIRLMLIEGGMQAGFPAPDGRGFQPWPVSADQAIRRIEQEWIALGRDPNIGEVVWFNNPADPAG